MSRKTFLTVFSCIAGAIGLFALFAPSAVLASKGVPPSEGANVWAREFGISIVASAVATFLLRDHHDSPTLRAFLIGNAVLQMGLFPIEIIAYTNGVITKASGIIPNSILHVVLAAAFIAFAVRIKTPRAA